MSSSFAPRRLDASVALRIRLYVAGSSPNSVAAVANLRAALLEHPDQEVDLEIIDLLVDSARGVQDGVLMSPMLVKLEPLPERRVLGNLSNRVELLRTLGFEETPDD